MNGCICIPCTTPAYGAPGFDHCAACCAGSMIAEYDHACPISEHRDLARAQWGTATPAQVFYDTGERPLGSEPS